MEYIERLEKTLDELESSAGKLSNLPELVKGINELVDLYREANSSTEKSQKQLDIIGSQLKERVEELQNALKAEQETKDELLNNIRSTLISNNKEQLDVVNSITSAVNNKIAIAESNIIVKATEIDNDVKQTITKISENGNRIDSVSKDILSVSDKICDYGNKTVNGVDELKSVIPIIKRTQAISIVAACLALVACILSVVI